MGLGFVQVQDNVPRLCRYFLDDTIDLNSNEEHCVVVVCPQAPPQTVQELADALIQVWAITRSTIHRRIRHMPGVHAGMWGQYTLLSDVQQFENPVV